MSSLLSIDIAITEFLQNIAPHTPLVERFFSLISFREVGVALFVLAVSFAYLYERGTRRFRLKLVYAAYITSFTAASAVFINDIILKNIFTRARPDAAGDPLALLTCPTNHSFPSGHAAGAFAAATMLALLDKNPRRRALYFPIALLIGYSRIYLGCHFFFDVLAGALVGLAVGWLLYAYPPFRLREEHRA